MTLAEQRAGFVVVKGMLGDLFHSQPAAVFDLDGVIFDSSGRFRKSLEEARVSEDEFWNDPRKRVKVWSIFLSDKYIELDKIVPEALGHISRARMLGMGIVILTGRPAKMISKTLEMLNRYDVIFNIAIFRSDDNKSKDRDYKLNVLRTLNIDVREIHDDVDDIVVSAVDMFRNTTGYIWSNGRVVKIISRRSQGMVRAL
jgi:phosphoglycolate phosphatase-like HAD superfamily hydrolase